MVSVEGVCRLVEDKVTLEHRLHLFGKRREQRGDQTLGRRVVAKAAGRQQRPHVRLS